MADTFDYREWLSNNRSASKRFSTKLITESESQEMDATEAIIRYKGRFLFDPESFNMIHNGDGTLGDPGTKIYFTYKGIKYTGVVTDEVSDEEGREDMYVVDVM